MRWIDGWPIIGAVGPDGIGKLDLAGLADGQEAGLAHFARTSALLAVLQHGGERSVAFVGEDGESTTGPTITADTAWIRSTWDFDGRSQFSYSTDGQAFIEFGNRYQLTWASTVATASVFTR